MSIKKWFAMGLCGAFLCGGVATAQEAETIDGAFKLGTLEGNLGAFFMNVDVDSEDSVSMMSAFAEFEFLTGEYEGLQLGMDILAVGEIYDDDDASVQEFYSSDDLDAQIRERFVKYNFMDSDVVIGRHSPMTPPILTADAYRGITLNVGAWKDMGIMACASVFDRAAGDIDWYDGISGWTDVEDMYSDVDDLLYSVMASFKMMDGMATVMPYLVYQGDFATVYGIQGAMDYEVEGGRIGGSADYFFVSEDSEWQEDDSDAWKLYIDGEMEGFSAGLGYFVYSDEDDQYNGEGWLGDLELVDDTLVDLFGETFMQDDAELWWLDLGYEWEGLTLAGQYGDYEAEGDIEAEQWMIKAAYDVTENFEAAVKYVDGSIEIGSSDEDIALWQVYGIYSF